MNRTSVSVPIQKDYIVFIVAAFCILAALYLWLDSQHVPASVFSLGGFISLGKFLLDLKKESDEHKRNLEHLNTEQESLRADQKASFEEHEYQRRKNTLDLIEKWTEKTLRTRESVRRTFPNDYKKWGHPHVVVSVEEVKKLFEAKSESPDSKLHYNLVALCNYFEFIALSYEAYVVDKELLKKDLSEALTCWYNFILKSFIEMYQQELGISPWRHYPELIEEWTRKNNANSRLHEKSFFQTGEYKTVIIHRTHESRPRIIELFDFFHPSTPSLTVKCDPKNSEKGFIIPNDSEDTPLFEQKISVNLSNKGHSMAKIFSELNLT